MNSKTKETAKPDYQPLQDELEGRYGPGLAQEIVEQIRKADTPDFTPEYMPVKAASEALEQFRNELRTKTGLLRHKRVSANDEIIDLQSVRLRQEAARLWGVYWLAQKGFYRLYKRTLAAYTEEAPATRKYKRLGRDQEMALAA